MAEPANLQDNDIPIHTACAFLITTDERARDMQQPPVYVLGHASGGRKAGDFYCRSSPVAPLKTWRRPRSGASTGRPGV